jgi:circadian clock protein KaiC
VTDVGEHAELKRFSTGIPGLDTILHGGLFTGSVYIVRGGPGTGKTILANQACFAHVAAGGRAVYVTLLAEYHDRLLQYLRKLTFYDAAPVPKALSYVSGFRVLEEGGLEGLMDLLRQEMNSRTLVVLDGLSTLQESVRSTAEYRKFIHELQGIASIEDCVVLLTSSRREEHPDETMSDGVITLDHRRAGAGAVREVEVRKLRGTDFLDGGHPFRITEAGITVYPRVEALFAWPSTDGEDRDERIPFGVPKLDGMVGGGLLAGSATLILGPSGSGKTTLGLHFLAQASATEPALHFGFYESPTHLRKKADGLGLNLDAVIRQGALEILWQPPTEQILDDLGNRLIDSVRRRRTRRLFVDGLSALFQIATAPDRLIKFFTALSNELRAQGVTTLYTAETLNVIGGPIETPLPDISMVFDNLILLRYVELRANLHRLLSVVKMRDSAFDALLREFVISKDGIDLADTFKSAEAILSGFARHSLPGGAGTGRPSRGKGAT